MTEFGHLEFAWLNILVASLMAPALVPLGATLSMRPALYAPPTPWQATFPAPSFLFSPEQVAGPILSPYTVCKKYAPDSRREGADHVADFRRGAGEDESNLLATPNLQIICRNLAFVD